MCQHAWLRRLSALTAQILQVSGRGKDDNAIALAAQLGLRAEDATVKTVAGQGSVRLGALCDDDRHKHDAEHTKAELSKWLGQRIKSHALVWRSSRVH